MIEWNEVDHPRDEDGKFALKNVGTNESKNALDNAAVLYGKITKEEKQEKECRNILLDVIFLEDVFLIQLFFLY